MRAIAIVGLGYVGLAVVRALARRFPGTLGFDRDERRVADIGNGTDPTGALAETGGLDALRLTADPAELCTADFFVVTVPTPIDAAKKPDLEALGAAARTVGGALRPGAIVVLESTGYPGLCEEWLGPRLEQASGLVRGRDFTLGYSPERINPGDPVHSFERVTKVIAAEDERTLDVMEEVYGAVVEGGVHRAPSIRVAEAAKVIENVQRDVNIALMNELALIFARIGLDTGDVLAAARTKWNFLPFRPGLVGGHCIGVDPYYLTHRAQEAGHHPELVLAGRRINESMTPHVIETCIRRLLRRGRAEPRVTVLGVTFKEDIPDIRNSRAADVVRGLAEFGVRVQAADPMADGETVLREHGFALTPFDELSPADAVILAVPHKAMRERGWTGIVPLLAGGRGDVLDVTGLLDRAAVPPGIDLWRL